MAQLMLNERVYWNGTMPNRGRRGTITSFNLAQDPDKRCWVLWDGDLVATLEYIANLASVADLTD